MGRGDSRSTPKMRRRKAQKHLKDRIVRRRAAARAERGERKPAAAPAPAATTKAGRDKNKG